MHLPRLGLDAAVSCDDGRLSKLGRAKGRIVVLTKLVRGCLFSVVLNIPKKMFLLKGYNIYS